MSKTILWIDVETTGLNPILHEIIEIAILPERGGELLEPFVAQVRPERVKQINPSALEVNGFTQEEIMGFPSRNNAYSRMIPYLREVERHPIDMVLAGHNLAFDVAFLQRFYWDCALDHFSLATARRWDTYSVASALQLAGLPMPDRLSLGALAEHFGVKQERAHRALDDAKTARAVWWAMIDQIREPFKTGGVYRP